MEKEKENLPVDEEENQEALVDYEYDSDSSMVTVVEKETVREKTMREDEEEKEKKKEIEARGAVPKQKPRVTENVDVTREWIENRPVLSIGTKLLYEKQDKMVSRIENVTKMLDKVLTKASSMMEDMVKVAHANLERERLKIRRLEVNKQNTQSKVENNVQTVKELEVEPKKRKLDEARVCSAEKDRSLEIIRSTIETELNNQRLHIRREYKLTQKSNFDLWMDYLKSELMNNDLLDVVDSNIKGPENLSELKVAKRKSLVRDIIINHLDENYHKRILNEKDPTEIVKKLRGYKKSEVNVTHASVRARLYQIKMRKDEKVSDFCERFDSIIKEYESCEDAVPLTEQEIRSAFYQAVSINVPELRNVDLIRRQTNLKEMNIDEIKSFMMQLEAESKSDVREKIEKPDVRAQRTAIEEQKVVKCYRCNKLGHMAKDCPLAGTDAWFCYYCQEIRGHKGDKCPNAGAQADRARGKRYANKTVNKNIKKKGRFAQRGTKRVDNKGKVTKIQSAKKSIPSKTTTEGKLIEGKICMTKLIEDRDRAKEIVNFIVDSGATDHIVNKNIILSNFEKCNNKIIKCANKNELADISIDGKGDLLLLTNEKRVIKLTNVIATREVSENLLSLRKLADAGFSIYLDDKVFKVYNKLTNKTVFEGFYEKPNWIIQFEVKNNNIEDNNNAECTVYRCRAEIVSHSELPEQSQANIQSNELSISEGELGEKHNVGSAIGRENEGELANVNENIKHNNAEPDQVIKLEDIQTLENIEEMCESSIIEKVKKLEKINEAMLWHVRLGHASLNYLRQLQKIEERLEKVKFDNSILECEICIMAKMAKLPFKENRSRAQRPLQVIHTDIMGPIKPTSYPGRKRFIITFIDDYSRLAKAYSLKTKDESGEALEKYLISARNLLGKEEKLCYVKSDQGKEFTGGAFKEILEREKIEAIYAPPYTPEHNGVAERFNRTLQEKVRAYMLDSGLPKSMWELAVDAAVHAYNRSPHKTIEYEIPLKKFSSETSCHFEQIKRFGCIGYARVPKPTAKFDKRAIRGVLIGYTDTGYILWHPNTRKFIESRHIRFNEKVTYKNVYQNSQTEEEKDSDKNWMKEFVEDEEKGEQKLEIPEKRKRGRPRKQTTQLDEPKQKVARKESETPMTRSKTKRKLEDDGDTDVRRIIEDVSFANYTNVKNIQRNIENENELHQCLMASLNREPVTYKEAMSSNERENWKIAVKEELESMYANQVWELVDRPLEKLDGKRPNIIDSRWVFKKKLEADGSTRYKARLVIRGCKDKNVYDLKETYAPVSRLSLVRSILAIINKYNLYTCQLDVKTAFLNGTIEEDIYMEIPDGVEVDENTKIKVCKLNRALYGLKISPKRWNKRFSEEAKKLGLENDLHEPCLFTWRKEGKIVIVLLYVDDMLVASNDQEKLEEIKKKLSETFETKDLGEPKNFLGITIERNKEEKYMYIHQTRYTENILEKFHMNECKPQSTPMVTRKVSNKNRKSKLEEKSIREEIRRVPYREAIGSLMYLANATRPDIAFAVNYLARRQLEPTEEDWQDVKRVFRYLRGTANRGLIFKN